jgi:hypothetical protein
MDTEVHLNLFIDFVLTRALRIHLLFLSEDPFVFAKRVAAAHKARKEAEAIMRYHLYINSMPIDVRALQSLQRDADAKRAEVKEVFGKAMNKIIFDRNLKHAEGSHKDMFAFLSILQDANNSSK